MKEHEKFKVAELALKKMHPKWANFINELMLKIKPVWFGTHAKDRAHFVHLLGWGKKGKAQEIITNLFETLDWHKEVAMLFQEKDMNDGDIYLLVEDFIKTNPILPKVVFTNMVHDLLIPDNHYDTCYVTMAIKDFLKSPKTLTVKLDGFEDVKPEGALIISYLDAFYSDSYIKMRLLLKHLLENQRSGKNDFRQAYMECEIKDGVESGLIRSEDLLFFAKDNCKKISRVKRLIDLKEILEKDFSKQKGFPVYLSNSAIEYYLAFVFHRDWSLFKLRADMIKFFKPLVQEMPSIDPGLSTPQAIEIQFTKGWKYQIL
jgi:hypothetical protein